MERNEVPFLCHGSNDYAKILWRKGEAIGFYSVKPKGKELKYCGIWGEMKTGDRELPWKIMHLVDLTSLAGLVSWCFPEFMKGQAAVKISYLKLMRLNLEQ